MLTSNMGLRLLDLTNTAAGLRSCIALADGIRSNVVLETLLLARNPLTDEGSAHLMTALNSNNSLHFLGMQARNVHAAHAACSLPGQHKKRTSVLEVTAPAWCCC